MTSKSSVSSGPRVTAVVVSLLLLIVASAAPTAWQDQPKRVVPVVAPAALEPLVPAAIEGWTKVRSTSNRVSDGCVYAFADTVYANGDAKLRVTVADTGFDADALATVATIVMSFPAGHTEKIPPDTVISRITYRDNPAATMWNNAKGEAEFTVVVGDRFVAKVEGTRVDGLDTLRGVLDKIDLKKLAEIGK
jgi:hypothetical protein